MKRVDWFIARHYLKAGKGKALLSLITWIALGGVTLGVAALITVISVMSGMQTELRGKILESTPHLYVLEWNASLQLHDYREVLDRLRTIDGVAAAAPFVLSSVTLVRDGGEYGQPGYLLGVDFDPAVEPATEMERKIRDGVLDLEPPESGANPVLVGSVLADRMGLFEGDTITIMSMENLGVNQMGLPQPTMRNFEVTGFFTTGMYEYDIGNLYTTFEAAKDLVGLSDADAGGIGIRTEVPDEATDFAIKVAEQLDGPYRVESWIERHQALFSALQLEKIALGVIVFLIVLVAAFNIVSTLVMVVADRTKEIGILRTMGMTEQGIQRVFQIQGVWIGVIGTVSGTLLGVGVSWALDRFELIKIPGDVYFVDHLPARMDPVDIGLIIVASLAVSFVATLYPARQASRLEPLDAIRHE